MEGTNLLQNISGIDTERDCRQKCRNHPACEIYTYLYDSLECFLLSHPVEPFTICDGCRTGKANCTESPTTPATSVTTSTETIPTETTSIGTTQTTTTTTTQPTTTATPPTETTSIRTTQTTTTTTTTTTTQPTTTKYPPCTIVLPDGSLQKYYKLDTDIPNIVDGMDLTIIGGTGCQLRSLIVGGGGSKGVNCG